MSEIFVATYYYHINYKHIYYEPAYQQKTNSIVVGLFENEEDAIRVLFQKLVEESCIEFESFFKKQYTRDKLIDMLYDTFNERKDENQNLNQNLRKFMCSNLCNIRSHILEDFGDRWGCKIESQFLSLSNAKPVMK